MILKLTVPVSVPTSGLGSNASVRRLSVCDWFRRFGVINPRIQHPGEIDAGRLSHLVVMSGYCWAMTRTD